MSETTISTPHHTLKAHFAVPAGSGPWPGVVIIHDIFGMSDDLRGQAAWLAGAGYLAVAPDLFSWGRKLPCLRATIRDLKSGRGPAFEDIDAARSWVASRSDCTGKVGIVGFCLGGAFAVATAAGHEFAASSINYGEVPANVDQILNGSCPIVGSFGGRDRMLKGHAQRLERTLKEKGIPHDVKEYPQAGHSFMNKHDGVIFKMVSKLTGTGYDESAAADARRRIIDFFARHLRNDLPQVARNV